MVGEVGGKGGEGTVGGGEGGGFGGEGERVVVVGYGDGEKGTNCLITLIT